MKEKLAGNEVVASMTVRFARSIEIAQIAKTAGFDTLYVDLEHNTLPIDTCCQICVSAQQIGITPLVRVPANTPDYIYRVLDGGAMGVITPPTSAPPPRLGTWSSWLNSPRWATVRLAARYRITNTAASRWPRRTPR